MAALAAHLVEHVFPRVPVRQWVVTYPKRLRYFLHRDPALWATVRRVTLRVIERHVRRACDNAPRTARCGAVSDLAKVRKVRIQEKRTCGPVWRSGCCGRRIHAADLRDLRRVEQGCGRQGVAAAAVRSLAPLACLLV